MSACFDQLVAVVEQCLAALASIQPNGGAQTKSASTKADYRKLSHSLLLRARYTEGGLAEVVQNTGRSTTFYKRVAALRYHCYSQLDALASELSLAADEAAWRELTPQFAALLDHMKALASIQQQGMTQPRRKRRSKRQALGGLPPDWRTALCHRGAGGKYAQALLVSALTGARPHELVKGIEVWRAYDEALQQDVICLHLQGAKVKSQQGQPNRFMTYAVDDANPLVAALVQHVGSQEEQRLVVQIAHGGNFTVEARRLARCLWPTHKHAITAYCFRHQWSADVKAVGDSDAVSRGLGHASAKTRRYYGTAGQSRSTDQLRPVRVEAERPIKGVSASVSVSQRSASSPGDSGGG